jgi:hypothetical protein
VGDFGVGFFPGPEKKWRRKHPGKPYVRSTIPEEWVDNETVPPERPKIYPPSETDWFFRGNHDNPEYSRRSKHYLGDFGSREIDGLRVFFVSGALSIDRDLRIEGLDWWPEEELSMAQLYEAIDAYIEYKPDVMLTHDGPDIATDALKRRHFLHKERRPSRTAQALNAMFEQYQPKHWVFGHWHVRHRETINGTDFRCLDAMGWCQIHGNFYKGTK